MSQITSTDSRTTWTFEVEGPGALDGYYTPKEDWDSPDRAALWLACALWDFGVVNGNRDAVTARLSQRLTPQIAQITGVSSWNEGSATVTVLRLPADAESMPESMGARRRVRQRQRRRITEQSSTA
ncbi:hypothetical protein AWB85_21685 [Mycobacteroides immunogenum]|uniref:Uncharacterized protein n=1 Tax=Mycobacteroides immunogenum TaxID=83262 RepID=A0A179VCM4_9MYCO|nr:hypothetical protein [Mycobacteroides immunogenum]OAT69377.1 hypothetical protein AWB85_21685 [Mycobacteroides immunogenum]